MAAHLRKLWVYVVEIKAFGNKAFCRMWRMQQFGDYSDKALDGLRSWVIFLRVASCCLKAEGELL